MTNEITANGKELELGLQQKTVQATTDSLAHDTLSEPQRLELEWEKADASHKIETLKGEKQSLAQERSQVLTEFQAQKAALSKLEQSYAQAQDLSQHVEDTLQSGNSAGQDVQLEKGLNYTFAQILSPANRTSLPQLEQLLGKAPQELNANDREVLKRFGLYVQTDQQGARIINLLTRQALSTQEVQDVQGAISTLATAATGPAQSSQSVLTRLAEASSNLKGLVAARQKIESTVAELDQATTALTESNQQVERLMQESQTLVTQVQAAEGQLQQLSPLVAQLRHLRDHRDLKDFFRQLDQSGQLESFQSTLQTQLGLDVRVEGRSVHFFAAGQELGPEAFVRHLEEALSQKRQQLQSLQTQLQSKQTDLQTARQDLEDKRETLSARQAEATQAHRDYQTRLAQAGQSLSELQAIRNNPEIWNQLDTDTQAQILQTLADLQAERARAPEIESRYQHALERAAAAMERTIQNLADLDLLLAGLNQLLQGLGATPQSAPQDSVQQAFDEMETALKQNPLPSGPPIAAAQRKMAIRIESLTGRGQSLCPPTNPKHRAKNPVCRTPTGSGERKTQTPFGSPATIGPTQ